MYTDQKYNWEGRDTRATEAKKHVAKMDAEFGKEIAYSVAKTELFDEAKAGNTGRARETMVRIVDTDAVSAIFSLSSGKTAVLNFASFHSPGGKFLEGSRAQEECLCHESTLYNVLREFNGVFYGLNKSTTHLYENRALYSPEIVFIHKGPTDVAAKKRYCDVITCAAPNKRAAMSYQHISEAQNSAALISRVNFVLDIAEEKGVDTLILGAYGCGVFGQDPVEVAGVFKNCLSNRDFRRAIFAIPNSANGNLMAFKRKFEEE